MNTTYTYIQTHKSLYENQVLSGRSSSRGAENQTPNMWLEGRGIGPFDPHVPYSAVTASKWSLLTASQQHHGSVNTAGERDKQSLKPKLSVHKIGARWAETIQGFPICFHALLHQSRLTMPWKNQQEVNSLRPMQLVGIPCS